MRLTKAQFCTAVNNYQSMLEEERDMIRLLDINPEWKCGEWLNTYYDFLNEVCELKEDPTYGTDLDWFCYETDFGKREDMCKIVDTEGRTWTITNPETLYDFITEYE